MSAAPSPGGEGVEAVAANAELRTWATDDLDMAAFILSQAPVEYPEAGIKVVALRRNGRSRDFTFVFLDPEGQLDELAVAYLNSPAHRFAAAVRTIKKLIHSQGNGGPRPNGSG